MPHVTTRDRTTYIRRSPQHLTKEHQKLNAPTLSLSGWTREKPCDDTRDYLENRRGRWVRAHGINRRTLFDPMHDEQPFCQDPTERRKTTIRFLGQQSEMTIDDTWPQADEMRSLRKGTEFWTNDMPKDDTWKPNRHHSNILPLFRNHLVPMFPPPPNPVASTEHVCRDSHLPAVPHTEVPKREVDVSFGECQNYPKCTAPTTTTFPVPKNLKTLVLKQQTQAVEDSIRAKGCRHLLVKPWPNGTAKYVSAVRCQLQRQGRDHWNQQVDPKETGDRRGEASFQPDGGGRRRRSQEIAGGSPYGGTISPEQSDRSSIPSGTNYGRSVPDQETVGGELGTSRLMTTRSKKRSMGGIKETKAMWERWCESILEEKLHSNKDTVHRFL